MGVISVQQTASTGLPWRLQIYSLLILRLVSVRSVNSDIFPIVVKELFWSTGPSNDIEISDLVGYEMIEIWEVLLFEFSRSMRAKLRFKVAKSSGWTVSLQFKAGQVIDLSGFYFDKQS